MNISRLFTLLFSITALLCTTAYAQDSEAGVSTRKGEFIIKGTLGEPDAPEGYILSMGAQATIRVIDQGIHERWELVLRAVQGSPQVVEIELGNDHRIQHVTGLGVQGWAVRPRPGGRKGSIVLVVALDQPLGQTPVKIQLVREVRKELQGAYSLLQIRARPQDFIQGSMRIGTQVGFWTQLTQTQGVRVEPVMSGEGGSTQLLTLQDADYRVSMEVTQSEVRSYTMEGTSLTAVLGDTATFDWQSRIAVTQPNGALIRLFGPAHSLTSPMELPEGVTLVRREDGVWLKMDKPGSYPVRAQFASKVSQADKQRAVVLDVAGDLTRPMTVQLPSHDYQLKVGELVVELDQAGKAIVSLPSTDKVSLQWQPAVQEVTDTAYYTVEGVRDIGVNGGLVEQRITLTYRPTQGGLNEVLLALVGEGDVLSLQAPGLARWQVEETAAEDILKKTHGSTRVRVIRIELNQPRTTDFSVQMVTRENLSGYPAVFAPLSVQPLEALRYVGHVGVRAAGQTKVSVVEAVGMTQLSPQLFPGNNSQNQAENVSLAFRHGGPEFHLRLRAERIVPRILVSQLLFYQVSLAGRQIEAEMDLDVREAPVSQLQIRIPNKYIVSGTQFNGQEVNQVVIREQDDHQLLTVFLPAPHSGKGSLKLRMEESRTFVDDVWKIDPVWIEGAEVLRGFIGVVANDGIRVYPEQISRLGEISPAYLPRTKDNVQVAWRAEHSEWSAALKLMQMSRVVRVDAFHLFTLAEESILGSSIMNILVTGAPVQSLRFQIPAEYRNMDITGEGVRTWKQDGDIVEVQFQGAASGAFTLLGTYEMPALKPGEKASFRGIKSAFAANELGVIALVSPLPYRVSVQEGNIEELESSRIPNEFQLLYNSPVVVAYQYHDHKEDLELSLTSLWESKRVEQNVESMRAESVVGKSGEVVTRIHYVLQSNRSAYLPLRLPENYRLWEAQVLNQSVTPVKDRDRLLVPLPAEPGENGRYAISFAIAHPSAESKRMHLQLPVLDVPSLNTSWVIRAEKGYHPGYVDGSVLPLHILQKVGNIGSFPWSLLVGTLVVLCLTASMTLLAVRARRLVWRVTCIFSAVLFAGLTVMIALLFAGEMESLERGARVDHLRFQMEVVPADALMQTTIQLYENDVFEVTDGNPFWWLGCAMALVSLVLAIRLRNVCRARWFAVLAVALWGYSLVQGISAIMILGLFVLSLLLLVVLPLARTRVWATTVLIGLAVCGGIDRPLYGEVLVQDLVFAPMQLTDEVHHRIHVGEHEATVSTVAKWHAKAGEQILLKRNPAVLKSVQYDQQKLAWLPAAEGTVMLWARESGSYQIDMETTIPVESASDWAFRLNLPLVSGHFTTAAMKIDRTGKFVLFSNMAVRIGSYESVMGKERDKPSVEDDEIWLLLSPSNQVVIHARPTPRDVQQETPVYYSEMSHLVQPVPGAVLAQHEFRISFAQGEREEFVFHIPEGQIVSSVTSPVRHWEFDAKNHLLRLRYEKPVQAHTTVRFLTESPQSNLPYQAQVAFPDLVGAQTQVGRVTLAVAEDVTVTKLDGGNSTVLSAGGVVLPSIEGKEYGNIRTQEVMSYAVDKEGKPFTLSIRAEAVDPEIRVESEQSVVLTEDRVVLSYQGTLFIDRAGVFALQMRIPEGFDLDSISAAGMTYWTYLDHNDKTLIQLNFSERIRGERKIAVVLSNNSYKQQSQMQLPKVEMVNANRETGWYHVQPELGLKIDLVQSQNSITVNPEEQGIQQRAGSLLLRILGKEWQAQLALTRMDPWIQVDSLQSYHYEEGRIEVKALLLLTVENSAIRQLRLQLPDNPLALQVRHERVSNVRKEEDGSWLISLDRRVIGKLELELSYDQPNLQQTGTITTGLLRVMDASRERRFVTIHTHPAIQMVPQHVSDEITPILWANIPERLRSFGQAPASNLVFRVAGNESGITLNVHRLDAEEGLLNTRVVETRIRTRLSDSGRGMTETRLLVHPGDERYLRFTIGKEDRLWTASVNGETAWVWREGDDWLIPLEKNALQDQPTEVRLFVEHAVADQLRAPEFAVPLQNISWVVHTPTYWHIDRDAIRSNLRMEDDVRIMHSYMTQGWSTPDQGKQTAKELIDLGNQLLSEGKMEAAGQAYKSSYNMSQNYEALNRDALVQWNRVRTQQAYMGISQRRGNIQSQAIEPSQQQMSQLAIPLQGGMDSMALTRLAQRLIEQQNAALVVPAPFTVVLPEGQEQTLLFSRPVLVDPQESLSIDLRIERVLPGASWSREWMVIAILVLCVSGCLLLWTRPRKAQTTVDPAA